MKILILTPLFPPDIGAPSSYVKTLLSQLTEYDVTLLLYGYLPESAGNTNMVILDKRQPRAILLIKSFFTLLKFGRKADLVIINNGPSTELPAWAASFFLKTPMVLCQSDPLAIKSSSQGIYSLIHSFCIKRMKKIHTLPENEYHYLKAEKLPFTSFNTTAETTRQQWWRQHILELTNT